MKFKEKSLNIVGRKREQQILNAIFQSDKAELLAVYGRRRVGKTFLLTTYFQQQDCVFFHCAGIQKALMKDQLDAFVKQIGETFYEGLEIAPQKKWMHAFDILTKAIEKSAANKKIVLLFDETPWMATRKSHFLEAFDYYWNRYWTQNNQLKMIVCGSSASWIIEHFINNKGGLYNRVTRILELHPFSLNDTNNFLINKGIKLNKSHVLELYMMLGGIPHYLSLVQKGMSATQAIDELCFMKSGELVKEFDRLFSSLFTDGEAYAMIIRIIGRYRYGLGQAELVKQCSKQTGGRISTRLKNLEEAGFIQEFTPYRHSDKGRYYKVIDEFCLFYLSWIEPNLKTISKQTNSTGYWLEKTQCQEWKIWSGYAFEAVCFKHIPEIRKALNINAGAEITNWRHVPKNSDTTGCQIDLLFDRNDKAMTVCEIKYNTKPFIIDKAYAKILLNKVNVFEKISGINKQVFIAMITASGIKPNMYSEELISATVTLEDLFKEQPR